MKFLLILLLPCTAQAQRWDIPLRKDLLEQKVNEYRKMSYELSPHPVSAPLGEPYHMEIEDRGKIYDVDFDGDIPTIREHRSGLWIGPLFLTSYYFWFGLASYLMDSRNPLIYGMVALLTGIFLSSVYMTWKGR